MPAVVACADWSAAPGKRWVVVARRAPAGHYEVEAPEPAGPALDALGIPGGAASRGVRRPGNERPVGHDDPSPGSGAPPVLLGVDFPLGIPAAYGAKVGLHSFRALLDDLGSGAGPAALTEIATTLGEVSLARPFYPAGRATAGAARRGNHAAALGLPLEALWRTCDRVAGAEALFWTLGPRQVGKAAIAGWQELLVPLVLASPEASSPVGRSGEVPDSTEPASSKGSGRVDTAVGLWPFDGELEELLATRHLVVAEVWPSMGRRLLAPASGSPRWSKRTVAGRRAQRDQILELAHALGACPSDAASAAIADGFVEEGEDGFDGFVGMLGMLDVLVRGEALPSPPARPEPAVLQLEGWILGLPAEGFGQSSKGGQQAR